MTALVDEMRTKYGIAEPLKGVNTRLSGVALHPGREIHAYARVLRSLGGEVDFTSRLKLWGIESNKLLSHVEGEQYDGLKPQQALTVSKEGSDGARAERVPQTERVRGLISLRNYAGKRLLNYTPSIDRVEDIDGLRKDFQNATRGSWSKRCWRKKRW